jgi:hypothetical protein
MTDVAIGFLLLGIGMLVVLGTVFAITLRGGPARVAPKPPRGVHLPPPSFLPVVMSVGALVAGAGLAFRAEDQFANLWLLIPGLAILILGIVGWVAAANREWRETERAPHDDATAH